jgi:5-formaminoimidazole-4-carboxamide-1-beta-D-ribofuranosyl 5'-monophosphate synthetase
VTRPTDDRVGDAIHGFVSGAASIHLAVALSSGHTIHTAAESAVLEGFETGLALAITDIARARVYQEFMAREINRGDETLAATLGEIVEHLLAVVG